MRRTTLGAAALTLAACTSSKQFFDGRQLPDTLLGTADAPPGQADAGPTAANVNCIEYDFIDTKSDGSSSRTWNTIALVDVGGPASRFRLEQCGFSIVTVPAQPPPATCPAGDTCTGSSSPPGTADCSEVHDGTFMMNGQLYVRCGWGSEAKNASGVVTSSATYSYSTVKVFVE